MTGGGTKKKRENPSGKSGVGTAAAVALTATVALIVLQLVQGPPDSTTLVLAAFAAVLLFALFAPAETNRFFQRMTNLKVAGVLEIGMQTVARAEILRPPPVEDEKVETIGEGKDLAEVVDEIEDKLRFVHAIVYMHDPSPPRRSEWQIALWLGAEGIFGDTEVQFVLDLLSKRELGVEALPERERAELLDAAWTFAVRFRFRAWDRFVRLQLQRDGWVIADFSQDKDHQADFLAYRDGKWALVATKVGEIGGYPYATTRERLEETKSDVTLSGWCVVFPGGDRDATVVSKKDGSGKGSKVKVLDLVHLLEKPERAFEGNPWNDDYEQLHRSDQA
jgi:hypothetical protein